MIYDIIIAGAGAAGMNCALYALRSGKTVLILEGEAVGGQIANSPKVENFPTIKEISGSEFADRFYEQITGWGAELEYDKVTEVIKGDDGLFHVTTEYGNYTSKAFVAAVGVKHRRLRVPGESELIGNGVYFCALCDGPFYKDREVAIIGDGNTAMQYAVILSGICSKVYVLTLTDKFFGDKVLENRMKEKPNVVHIPNVSVTEFVGEGKLESIKYKNKGANDLSSLSVTAAFVSIGQVPDNEIFSNLASLDDQGYFICAEDGSTDTPGFFVAGDCRAKKIRQLATAVSDGAVAALTACEYIDKL